MLLAILYHYRRFRRERRKPSGLLDILFGLQTKTDTSLMVTTRPSIGIEQSFQEYSNIEIRANDDDVKCFVDDQLHRLPKFVRGDAELQREIKDGIVQAVDGVSVLWPYPYHNVL